MIWAASLLFKIPLLWRVAVYAVMLVSLWGGFKYWKHTVYKDGYNAGALSVQDEWDAAVKYEIGKSIKDRADAERDVERAGDDGMRDDPYNRDNWGKGEGGKPGG